MNQDRFDADLRGLLAPERVQRHEPLAELTTFRVGGPADWLVYVRSVAELVQAVVAAG